MRANATFPSFDPSATTIALRRRLIRARFVCASTSWWVVQPASVEIPSTPTKTRSRLSPASATSAIGPTSS